MSYSFSLRAATKAEAKTAVAAKLDEVVSQQPLHQLELDASVALADAIIELLPQDDTRDVAVSMNGSVSWTGVYPESHVVKGIGVSFNAYWADRV